MSLGMLAGIPGKVKTLLDRLTATRAGYIDTINTNAARLTATRATNFDTIVTSIATLKDSRLTSTRAGYLDNLATAPVAIANIISGTGALSASGGSSLTVDITITPNLTDYTKAFVAHFSREVDNGASDASAYILRARIISNSVLRVTRAAAGGVAADFAYTIIEFA